MKIRRQILSVAALCGIGLMIWKNKLAYNGAIQGLMLCYRVMVPSIFPFLYLSNLFVRTVSTEDSGVIEYIANILGIPSNAKAAIIPAFLGGYPVGAKTVADLYKRDCVDKLCAERMLSFCSNAGPAFLFGMVAMQFPKRICAWCIWGIQLVSAWFCSRVFPIVESKHEPVAFRREHNAPMEAAILAMAQICGWVILFRIVIELLNVTNLKTVSPVFYVILSGIIDLSNGCTMLQQISSDELRFIAVNGLLSFGSLCVLLQTISVCQPLRIRYYMIGKIMQAVLSSGLAWLCWNMRWFPILIIIVLSALLSRHFKKGVAFRQRMVYNTYN